VLHAVLLTLNYTLVDKVMAQHANPSLSAIILFGVPYMYALHKMFMKIWMMPRLDGDIKFCDYLVFCG
jgi:hypothetical protein